MRTEPTYPAAQDDGLAIYVHWPFCLAKCPYCDFNSHVRDNFAALDQDIWAEALVTDLKHDIARLPHNTGPATSLFFGGGTPSLMSGKTVARVIDAVAGLTGLAANAEITLEANPTSAEADRFQDYVAAGVNRFSLGVQALRDEDLEILGRQHSVAEARIAIEMARRYADNVSFDLIYARPGQTPEAWRQELDEALAMAPSHLSLYQLTIERGTRFYERWRQGDLVLPDEDVAADMFDQTNETCAAHGLPVYEVSNYARPGSESRHNISYWRFDPYVGIGPGAHGRLKIEQSAGDGFARLATSRLRSPEKWLARVTEQGHGTETEEAVSGDTLVAEVLMMGLRLMSGLPEKRFYNITGKSFDQALQMHELTDLQEHGFLTFEDAVLAVTPKGRNVLNTITEKLL